MPRRSPPRRTKVGLRPLCGLLRVPHTSLLRVGLFFHFAEALAHSARREPPHATTACGAPSLPLLCYNFGEAAIHAHPKNFRTIAALLLLLRRSVPRANRAPAFAPLDHWRQAIFSGDPTQLSQSLQRLAPGSDQHRRSTNSKRLRRRDLLAKLESKGSDVDQTGNRPAAIAHARRAPNLFPGRSAFLRRRTAAQQNLFIATAQYWVRRDARWQIATAARGVPARLRQPLNTDNVIYPPDLNARAEIADGLRRAAATKKRVLLVFGGNWCFDCHVLDEAFHSPEIQPTLARWVRSRPHQHRPLRQKSRYRRTISGPAHQRRPRARRPRRHRQTQSSASRTAHFKTPAPWRPKTSSPS